jgi:hypothetical protein
VGDDPDRAAPTATGNRDVEGEALAPGDDPEELTGRPVAENGARSAGEDRGESAPLLGDERMTDRIDAAMEAVQKPAAHPVADPRGGEPERE